MILNSTTITMIVGVSIILIAIAISSGFQVQEKSFSQVITVGPVWNSDSWVCTSDADFMVYGVLRGLAGSLIEITISDVGSQSLYSLDPQQLESFSIGASGDTSVLITRTGTVTGFITLQTTSDASAICAEV